MRNTAHRSALCLPSKQQTPTHLTDRQVTFLFLHRRSDVSMLVPVDGIDNLIASTHLHSDDRVFELRDTRVYRCRQAAVGGVSANVAAQLLHARQQRLHLQTYVITVTSQSSHNYCQLFHFTSQARASTATQRPSGLLMVYAALTLAVNVWLCGMTRV